MANNIGEEKLKYIHEHFNESEPRGEYEKHKHKRSTKVEGDALYFNASKKQNIGKNMKNFDITAAIPVIIDSINSKEFSDELDKMINFKQVMSKETDARKEKMDSMREMMATAKKGKINAFDFDEGLAISENPFINMSVTPVNMQTNAFLDLTSEQAKALNEDSMQLLTSQFNMVVQQKTMEIQGLIDYIANVVSKSTVLCSGLNMKPIVESVNAYIETHNIKKTKTEEKEKEQIKI